MLQNNLNEASSDDKISLAYLQEYVHQSRARWREAHTLIVRFGQALADVSGQSAPNQDTWALSPDTSPSGMSGQLDTDRDNAATLSTLIASVSGQLGDMFDIAGHRARTRTSDITADTVADTGQSDTDTKEEVRARLHSLETENLQLRKQRDQLAEVNEIQKQRLSTAMEAHLKLKSQYTELWDKASEYRTSREDIATVVSQWNTLCVELYRRTNGRPKNETNQRIIATWNAWRETLKNKERS